jgi:hypothetical protein
MASLPGVYILFLYTGKFRSFRIITARPGHGKKKLNAFLETADTSGMKLALIFMLLTVAPDGARLPDSVADANAAFYAGENLNYVFEAPPQFRMAEEAAVSDGYSFAFVPQDQEYNRAQILIGINIYKTRGIEFDKVLLNDTVSIREHFGEALVFEPVESLAAASGQMLTAFRLTSGGEYLPNLMIAYLSGETELLIFELVITDKALRFVGEDKFAGCIQSLKVLPRRTIGER